MPSHPSPEPPASSRWRPALKPGLRRLWRDPHTVQFGTDPDTAVVVPEVDDAVAAFLLGLDGHQTRAQVVSAGGLPPETASVLLDGLVAHGVLDDAAAVSTPFGRSLRARRARLGPELTSLVLSQRAPGDGTRAFVRRQRTCLQIEGLGRLGASLTVLLHAAGLDHLRLLDPAPVREVDVLPGGHRSCDIDQPRDRVLHERLAEHAHRAPTPPSSTAPALVVLAGRSDLPELRRRAQALVNAGQPHLVVDVVEGVGRLGPLVVPGETACLTCVDHHRTDRDPAWPRLMAQLSGPAHDEAPAIAVTATAAWAAWHITSWVDGGLPPSVDAELTMRPPDGIVSQHPYPRHPSCGCAWRQQAQSPV